MASGRICRHPRSEPAAALGEAEQQSAADAGEPGRRRRPQPICDAALCSTAEGTPPLSSALAMSRATRKNGTPRPSLSPLSTSSAWRTRAGTDVVGDDLLPERRVGRGQHGREQEEEPKRHPGEHQRPDADPGQQRERQPDQQQTGRPGQLVPQRPQVQPHRVAEQQQHERQLGDASRRRRSRGGCRTGRAPRRPTARPASMNTSADVIPRRSSGLENVDQRMRMTATVPSASMPQTPVPRARPPHPRRLARILAAPASGATWCGRSRGGSAAASGRRTKREGRGGRAAPALRVLQSVCRLSPGQTYPSEPEPSCG